MRNPPPTRISCPCCPAHHADPALELAPHGNLDESGRDPGSPRCSFSDTALGVVIAHARSVHNWKICRTCGQPDSDHNTEDRERCADMEAHAAAEIEARSRAAYERRGGYGR